MARSTLVVDPGLTQEEIAQAQVPTDVSGGTLLGFQSSSAPVDGVDEVHTVDIANATGGTWNYSLGGYSATGLAYNISTANLQTALRAMANIAGANVTVSGTPGTQYVITFTGSLAGKPIGTPSVTDNTTGSGHDVSVEVTTAGVAGTQRGAAGPGALLLRTDVPTAYLNVGTLYKQEWSALAFEGA